MQDFYRCEAGYENLAQQVARNVCQKLVPQMLYEARVQAIVDFNASQDARVKKKDAIPMTLTREEYLQVNDEEQASIRSNMSTFDLLMCHMLNEVRCRRFRGGWQRILSAGRIWWTSGAAKTGRRSTRLADSVDC